MRPQLHKLPLSPDSSFIHINWECNYFDKSWHFHKEYELVLIDQTKGTRFIGDKVSFIKESDLMLIGPNIPHLYKNSEEYYQDKGLVARSSFIHFTDDFLGNSFFQLPEMKLVQRLLDRSSLGLEVLGKANKYVRTKLKEMESASSANKLIKLLEILVFLSTNKELVPLLSRTFIANNTIATEKINTAFQFILKNFKQEIYIEEIADKLNMSIASFSRYFKHHTRKTFSNYVTEVRISHACQLLMEGNLSIAEICYQSGFENLSNFYRHFKKNTGLIPKEYQSRFLIKALSH